MGEVAKGPPRRRAAVKFSAEVGRAICARVAAGETIQRVCNDPAMPTRGTVSVWARESAVFRRALSRAQTLGSWDHEACRRPKSYCEVTAMEIYARLAEGETMTAVCADPAMPSHSTVVRWRNAVPEFAERLALARQVQAERFCDLGWEIASAVTPGDAYATHVKLMQLRWTAAAMAPARFGRYRPVKAEAEADEGGPSEVIFRVRHFETVTGADGRAYVRELPELPAGDGGGGAGG